MATPINIMVVEGNTAATNAQMRKFGATPYGIYYANLLESLCLDLHATVVHPAEDGVACLPVGKSFTDFEGVVWTGSALSCYEPKPEVEIQLQLARQVFESGIPCFGSCWGLQVFTQALGGRVRKNPKGREVGIAQGITLNWEGRAHPMLKGRPSSYCVLAVHQDEVEEPAPGTTVLAGNAVSEVQAAVIESGNSSFWGVQYHPEFNFPVMAGVYRRLGQRLVEEGFFATLDELESAARTFEALNEESPLYIQQCSQLQFPREVVNARVRQLEISNWIEEKLLPHRPV